MIEIYKIVDLFHWNNIHYKYYSYSTKTQFYNELSKFIFNENKKKKIIDYVFYMINI